MVEIKKLVALKKQSEILLGKVEKDNPLHWIESDFVSASGLTRNDLKEKLEKVKSCCSIVELQAHYQEQPDKSFDQVMKVSNGNFCKQHTICPVCSDRSQSRRRARFNEPIKEQASLVNEGKRYAYIVTYTVTDGESLSERLEHLKESRLKWRKMGQKRGNRFSGGEASKIKAGISTIEIKRGIESGLWHVHAHELLFTSKPLDYQVYDPEIKKALHKKYGSRIPKEILSAAAMDTVTFNGEQIAVSKISKEWLDATGGDSISIDVERLQHVPRNASYKRQRKLKAMTFEQSIAYQAKEVLKYITDTKTNRPEDILQILTETYNKRMVATYGEFRGTPGSDYEIENSSDSENYVIVWNNGKMNYESPIPGKYSEFKEEEHETRKTVAQMLGQYRRERKKVLESGIDSLSIQLDLLKLSFKESVNKVWQFYRNKVRRERDSHGCDNYNSILSLQNLYIQADSTDIYDMAFS